MKYKCIKDFYIEDSKIISDGDIIIVDDTKTQIYNLTRGVDILNIPIDMIIKNLVNIDDWYDTPNTDYDKFVAITKEMRTTYKRKNHDYGNSFGQSLDKFGLIASAVRVGDKINRFESLITKDAKVVDESIRDTLLDAANYLIMTVMWMDDNNKNL